MFNGCSYTAGTELEGIDRNFEFLKEHRYSHIISKKTNKTYINISKPASSNDRIVRETINWFEEGNTCDFAIIQFSHITRYEWVADDGSYVVFLPKEDKYTRSNNSFVRSMYYKSIYNTNFGINLFYKNLFLLEQYFKNKNINHYFIKLDYCEDGYDNSKSMWKTFCTHHFNKIDSIIGSIIPPKKYSSFFYCKRYPDPLFPGSHPNALGHLKIADYLLEKINYLH